MPREAAFTPLTYEQWETFSLKNPQLIPEGYFIAKDGANYVGMSNVHRVDNEPHVLNQDDTGVIREYRGRGISDGAEAQGHRVRQEEWISND